MKSILGFSVVVALAAAVTLLLAPHAYAQTEIESKSKPKSAQSALQILNTITSLPREKVANRRMVEVRNWPACEETVVKWKESYYAVRFYDKPVKVGLGPPMRIAMIRCQSKKNNNGQLILIDNLVDGLIDESLDIEIVLVPGMSKPSKKSLKDDQVRYEEALAELEAFIKSLLV